MTVPPDGFHRLQVEMPIIPAGRCRERGGNPRTRVHRTRRCGIGKNEAGDPCHHAGPGTNIASSATSSLPAMTA